MTIGELYPEKMACVFNGATRDHVAGYPEDYENSTAKTATCTASEELFTMYASAFQSFAAHEDIKVAQSQSGYMPVGLYTIPASKPTGTYYYAATFYVVSVQESVKCVQGELATLVFTESIEYAPQTFGSYQGWFTASDLLCYYQ